MNVRVHVYVGMPIAVDVFAFVLKVFTVLAYCGLNVILLSYDYNNCGKLFLQIDKMLFKTFVVVFK